MTSHSATTRFKQKLFLLVTVRRRGQRLFGEAGPRVRTVAAAPVLYRRGGHGEAASPGSRYGTTDTKEARASCLKGGRMKRLLALGAVALATLVGAGSASAEDSFTFGDATVKG